MRWASRDPATAFEDAPVPVLPWPPGAPPPVPPDGHAGIAVRTWYGTRWDRRGPERPRTVGVDGAPVWHGWGRMVMLVAPGTHLVEVRGEHVEGVRAVAVAAGEVAELEYVGPRNWGSRGLLGVPPMRQAGATTRPWLVAIAVFLAGPLVLRTLGLPERPRPVFTAALLAWLVLCAAGVLVANRLRREREERRRIAGAAPPVPVGSALLLGHRGQAAGTAGSGLELHAELSHTVAAVAMREPYTGGDLAWVPHPRVRIDGEDATGLWGTCRYALDPGGHAVRVEVAAPPGCRDGAPVLSLECTVAVPVGGTARLAVAAVTAVDAYEVPVDYSGMTAAELSAALNESYRDWAPPVAGRGFRGTVEKTSR